MLNKARNENTFLWLNRENVAFEIEKKSIKHNFKLLYQD